MDSSTRVRMGVHWQPGSKLVLARPLLAAALPPARLHTLPPRQPLQPLSSWLRADEELEEQDVDVENQYYNSKGLLESEEWEEALAGFRQVLRMEGGDKGEW